jgi:hypothetical protein
LPAGLGLALGSATDADLALPRESGLALRHVELCLEPGPAGAVRITDLAGQGDVLLNRAPVQTGRATPGDVLQFGRRDRVASTALLFHYDLAYAEW